MTQGPAVVRGWLNIGLTALVVSCVLVILVSALFRWLSPTKPTEAVPAESSSDLGTPA